MNQWDPEQVPGHSEGEARARAHPRTPPVVPADRHDRQAVPASASEIDDLDIEHDAGDLLAREEIVRCSPRESLEAALRVAHGADDPDRREDVERLAEEPPIAGLRGA